MKHQQPKRVGNDIHGTKYVFTLPLTNGNTEKVTLEPSGQATHWWRKGGLFGNKIIEIGSEGCYSWVDSNPNKLIKKVKSNKVILCDSGACIFGSQVFFNQISCVSGPCVVPMVIDRKEWVDSGC